MHGPVQMLGELCAIKHDERPSVSPRYSLWGAQTEANKGLVVIAKALAPVRLNQLLNPFAISWRREFHDVGYG